MTHTISHYRYTIEVWPDGDLDGEPRFIYNFLDLYRVKQAVDHFRDMFDETGNVICLSMTEVYCCGYEVPIDKVAWSDKNDFTNIYNFIIEQEIRDTWIEKHLKGVEYGATD